MRMRIAGFLAAVCCIAGSPAFAASDGVKATAQDKCPVCGMFVAKYPEFAAQIRFRDGRTVHFDGTKDMFKYYLNLSHYAPGKKAADVSSLLVSNYYDLSLTDGFKGYYVIGSDVLGPMGQELIPFRNEKQAHDFLKDHRGKRVLRFQEVTPALVKTLE